MKLYRRNYTKIEKTLLTFSNKNRDFGIGFYLTSDLDQAKIWSIKKVAKLDKGKPTVSIYSFDNHNINDLNIKTFIKADKEWYEYVLNNKKIIVSDNYDIVISPIVNDETYEVINLYIRGILTKNQAISRLKTYKLKDQFAFKTERALRKLK